MITVKADISDLNITEDFDKFKKQFLDDTATELIRSLQIKSPVDEGNLQNSWTQTASDDDSRQISSDKEYADYVNNGTGVFGPTGSPILPKNGGVLVFTAKSGDLVFAKSVQGIEGKHFVEASIEEVEGKINSIAINAWNRR